MISVDEAIERVLAAAAVRQARSVSTADALGLVLAEDVVSDIDSPPFDKSMVDGYAVVAGDFRDGSAELTVLEEVVAGATPSIRVAPGAATRIMTGAPIPEGADAVVMIERSQPIEGAASTAGNWPSPTSREHHAPARVRLIEPRIESGQNILRRGVAMRRGDVVLNRGRRLRAIELGLLSEVGRTAVLAVPRPAVAVFATGNELVPHGQTPALGQIRNSNGPMLVASVRAAGADAVGLGVARDEPNELRARIQAGLESDVLVLSGGVSAGVLDLVPAILADLGVEQVFHKVSLRPGKPLWFGVARNAREPRLVFGLPGNPVSSLVCFELFVRPAIERMASRAAAARTTMARLTSEYRHRGERTTFHPAMLRNCGGDPLVEPLAWQGSADLRGLSQANALAKFGPGERTYAAGDTVAVYLFDDAISG